MAVLKVRHKTTYRYRRPVELGEHRMMFRPRASHDLALMRMKLDISPRPASIRWVHDVFGNSVALARFNVPAETLSFESTLILEHLPDAGPVFEVDESARRYPFVYDAQDAPDLSPSSALQYPDEGGRTHAWAKRFLHPGGATDTLAMLATMTCSVREEFKYARREEMGVQDPIETLLRKTGSCRDFAVLMMEAVRTLGLAARFVSGYLYVPSLEENGLVGGGATHAWVQVYLPGAGWVEFDPTNGIVGNRDLIRIAVARHPRQAIPLSGTYEGTRNDNLGMQVEVAVTEKRAATERSPLNANPGRLRSDAAGAQRDRDAADAERASVARPRPSYA